MYNVRFEDMHRGGWDPDARLGDQDRDGISAEILYPTVGMMLCNHPDFEYKQACFDAYNGWIAEYCATHPDRLLGIGQTAMRSVEAGIADLHAIKKLGLRGVMMPGNPAVADYHDPLYDPFYEAAVDLGFPLSFHILTSSEDQGKTRGPKCVSTRVAPRAFGDGILLLLPLSDLLPSCSSQPRPHSEVGAARERPPCGMDAATRAGALESIDTP